MQREDPIVFKFYQSKSWKNAREAYMKDKNYICERCGQAAYFCHHKIYITVENINDTSITLDWDNLEALCKDCHNKEHFKQEEEYYFDENGDLIKYEK